MLIATLGGAGQRVICNAAEPQRHAYRPTVLAAMTQTVLAQHYAPQCAVAMPSTHRSANLCDQEVKGDAQQRLTFDGLVNAVSAELLR
jgi:hypothetical protein